MTENVPAAPAGRGIGIAAVVAGGLTLAALIVAIIWIAAMMGGGAGGFAIMGVLPIMGPVVAVLGVVGVVLSVVAISRKNSRRLGTAGMVMSAAPIVVWVILLIVALVSR